MDGVFLSAEEYALLLKKASLCPNFSENLVHLPQPEMDPSAFKNIWRDAGASNLYGCINDVICSDPMSAERKQLSKFYLYHGVCTITKILLTPSSFVKNPLTIQYH